MAFVKGYITKYECPKCGDKLSWVPELKAIEARYLHTNDGVLFHNGIPYLCENNGKILNHKDVIVVNCPDIVSGK